MDSKVKKGKLVQKIVLIAIAAIVGISIVLTVISGLEINGIYDEIVKEELKVASQQLESEFSNSIEGDWRVDGEKVYKGDTDVTEKFQNILDELKSKTDIEYSLFAGNVRMITTMKVNGQRITGFKVPDKIKSVVLDSNKEYYSPGATPAGAEIEYYSYYTPLLQDDGTPFGMVYSGRGKRDVDIKLLRVIMTMVVISFVIAVVLSVLGMAVSAKVSKKMKDIAHELSSLSKGDLNLHIDKDSITRRDEIGLLADGAQTLSDKLGDVVSKTVHMSRELEKSSEGLSDSASQASSASSQVGIAIEEISKGASTQAQSVETASGRTQDIELDIDEVSSNINELNNYSEQMKTSCEAAMDALKKLIEQSTEVKESVKDIGQTIESTNESAKEISNFTQAITEIASQTNLLSLNASIEAARAGDAGKGFAVVATEIGQLAVQSSQSAEEIKKIVEKLVLDSEESVKVMQRLNTNFEQQAQQLEDTKSNMQDMSENVENVSSSTENIAKHIDTLNTAKNHLVEIITDLSAISQENAASAEETNASMQELAATFTVITDEAIKLQSLASNMTETISYFNA
ncbi:methyl-accepting chemotaxis protein [Butyrivibrio sp. NC3005]|uniref:methyl-accepting chemotaxis protein n=1 Tax=Butyrivibrio sp. NC3005 TaxID=1280685 RepID=UPI0003F86817|nr:methyl-accepting chemotaxis protein [Butyrivibrio sp. NC3005]